MGSITNKQLQDVIAQLDQAISSHDQWYKNLQRVLITHAPPEESDLKPDAHRLCRFGEWYGSTQVDFMQENPLFVSLGELHEKMHTSARYLIQRVLDGLPISVSDWDHFDNTLDRMRLKIQALRDEYADIEQNRDPLTEAQTRSNLLSDLREQRALVERGKQVCILAMLDLDHFKRINDEFGHVAGDDVLVATVRCVKSQLRSYDRIYRYGGEEFMICMPSTTIDEAREVMERIREAIAEQHFEFTESQVTASFGVTVLRASQTVEESIKIADEALYVAKAAGRNRVVFDI
ncbi:diguanylate cyclase [Methylophaga sp.]|uniref:diguanylate cyclase n=1 Tax=Methylophaga sp. TaxID=2024840 RepID=UPI003F6A08EE